jgi:hypothetical protein
MEQIKTGDATNIALENQYAHTENTQPGFSEQSPLTTPLDDFLMIF